MGILWKSCRRRGWGGLRKVKNGGHAINKGGSFKSREKEIGYLTSTREGSREETLIAHPGGGGVGGEAIFWPS